MNAQNCLSDAKCPPQAPKIAAPRRGAPSAASFATMVLEPLTGDFTDAALELRARRLLKQVGCDELAREVKVRWNKRLRTTAGLACYNKWLVALNPRLIIFGMPEVDRTLRHELAHLLARYRMGRHRIQPHGVEWRQACLDLGLREEKRCHELPLPRRQMRPRHLYRCRHCQLEVWRVRPFRRSVACLKCCRTYNGGRYADRYRFVKA